MKKLVFIILLGITVVAIGWYRGLTVVPSRPSFIAPLLPSPAPLHPLSIAAMRQRKYVGSDITIEKTLPDGSNYHQYLTSYLSDGIKIYALLTVPTSQKPKNGWPVIIFNHGYISPDQYQTFPTVGQYASYYPQFSKNGYIVFKPDYRGNGNSEGKPEGAYYSPAYTIDVLNALSTIKQYKDSNPTKIGMWGHSLGGNITLRSVVVNTHDIRAAVIWGGVIGSYTDLLYNWQRRVPYVPSPRELALRNSSRLNIIQKYGSPSANLTFWNSIDPTFFVKDISTPIQLHTGESDEEVPADFSRSLYALLHANHKTVELYVYPRDNHNISFNFTQAMERSLAFFDTYLK